MSYMQVNLEILKLHQELDESWILPNKQANKEGGTTQALNCLIGTIKSMRFRPV